MQPDRLPKIAVSIDEAVQMTGICRSAMYKHIRAGDLPVVKVGRSTRLLVSDIEAWLVAKSRYLDER